MYESMLLPLIVALPLASAAVLAAFRNRWPHRVIGWAGTGVVLVTFLLSLAAFAQLRELGGEGVLRWVFSRWEIGGRPYAWGLVLDPLGMWWLLVVTGVGFLIHLYSIGYMAGDESYGRFFACLNYFVFAMSLLVMADNFLGLVMGWTNVGLASYMLIGFYIRKPSANAAQMKAYLTNMVGEVFMLAGIAVAVIRYGSITFDAVFQGVQADPGWATAIGLLILGGAAAKSAQLPLHIWLPDAMEGPTPVSAMLHAATMVTAGVYAVARLYPIYQASETAMTAVATVGALSALAGALAATRQYDIKKVLAYSTMSQIGYMFLANGVGAHGAAAFHFLTHAFFKAALFLCAGIIIHELGGQQDIRRMGGLREKMPFAYWTFLIGVLALIGLPPFAGFFSKDEILAAALNEGHYFLFALGVVAAGLTAFYNTRLFSLVFLGDPLEAPAKSGKRKHRREEEHHDHGHHETPWVMKAPVAVLAALSVVGGAFVLAVDPYLHPVFARFEAREVHIHAPVWAMALILGVAALGIWAAWALYGPRGSRRQAEQRSVGAPAGLLGRAFYFDEIYELFVYQPVLALADLVGHYADPRGVDGLVNGLARMAYGLGGRLGWLHSGYVRRYGLTLVIGLVAVLIYFAFYV
nr:MAG: NADH-quinone oxidoreductase subunit L [Bacillota bacterium]